MALDASIYNQVGQGVRSVADYDAIANQQQTNKLQQLMLKQQYDNSLQANADDASLRDATKRFGTDSAQNRLLLAGTGNYKALSAFDKAQVDNQKAQADIAKDQAATAGSQLEQKIKAHDFHLQRLGGITDLSQVPAWVQEGVDTGVMDAQKSAVGLKLFVEKAQREGLDAAKAQAMQGGQNVTQQLQQKLEAEKIAEQQRQFGVTSGESQRHNRTTEGLAARGQDMVDRRSRETTTAAMTKPFEVTGPDGAPMLVQQDKQGNITPVQGFGPKTGASKPLNDTQAKALLFGTRMQEADKILGSLDGKYSPTAINTKVGAENIGGFTGAIAGSLGNAMLSEPNQQAEQAQRDFINAVLRRESGAAIAPSEFTNAQKQYFDQPNDQPGTRAQKARNRQIAIKGLLAEVPQGQRGAIDVPASPAAAPAAAPVQTATNPQTGQKIMLVNGQWVPAK